MANNWKNIRVGVSVTTMDGKTARLQLPNRIVLNTKRNYEKVHGIEAYNQGVIVKATDYTFSVSVPDNTTTVEFLRNILETGAEIDTFVTNGLPSPVVEPGVDEASSDFKLIEETFHNCYLDGSETSIMIGDLPYTNFTGFALGKSWKYTSDFTAGTIATMAGMLGADIPADNDTIYDAVMASWA